MRAERWMAGWLVFAAALCGAAEARAQAATPVAQLDLKQMVGTWYESMRLPVKAEKHCVQETTVLYALGDKNGRFSVVRTCPVKDGFTEVKNLDGRVAAKGGTDGRLKVRTVWPFYRKYDVLALGPGYTWAVLGTANHKEVWVLSREATLAPDDASAIKAKVAGAGFDVAKLVMPPSATGVKGSAMAIVAPAK